MPDQVLPTWGQSLGQGMAGGFENYMNQRALARKARIEDATLAMQYAQLDQAKGEAGRKDMEFARETGVAITPREFGLGRDMSQAAGMAPDPAGFRERLEPENAKALNLFDEFMSKSGPKGKADGIANVGNVEKNLRGELRTLSDDFMKVRDAFGRVRTAAQKPSAAGDLSLIFNYMKILDPGSTVREGEFANAANSGSIPARATAAYNNVMRGERLSDEMRKDFVEKAEDLYQSQARMQKKVEEEYRGLATRSGGAPENVVLDFGLPPQPVLPGKKDPAAFILKLTADGLNDDQIKVELKKGGY